MKLSSNVVGDSNDEKSFLHKLLLIGTQVSRLLKVLANGSSANMKLSKTQLHKIGLSGGCLSRLLEPLLETRLPLNKNVLKLLAKNVLTTLGLTAEISAKDAAVQKKIFGSGMTTLTISNKKINDIMKVFKPHEESALYKRH